MRSHDVSAAASQVNSREEEINDLAELGGGGGGHAVYL